MWNGLRALLCASMAAIGLAGCGTGTRDAAVPPAAHDEAALARDRQAFVEAMKPRRPGRPVVAMLALNEGTELADLLLPHAVLQRADVADVRVVAPRAGRVRLFPALQVEGAQDFATFDRAHPAGADYVIVPAMEPADAPAVRAWLQQQASRGARVIGVCSGALVLAQAGLLDGRRFAGHWYDRGTLRQRPGATHVPDRRYLVERDVATTTGITASVPATLALVEAIGGPAKAAAMAAELGVDGWGPAHASAPFGLTTGRGAEYLFNKAAFWRGERRQLEVRDGADDIALALATDAWTRTGHVDIEAVSPSGPVKLRSGLVLVAGPATREARPLPLVATLKPVQQLDRTLCEIAGRYGNARRDWVMQEMEYPRTAANTACAS
jgi:putative intracellular protease/amidase